MTIGSCSHHGAMIPRLYRRACQEGFPVTLFGLMWLLAVAFILSLMPIVRNVRTGGGIVVKPVDRRIRVALLILIVSVWTGIMIDQFPCFMGVPLCD